MMVCLIVIGDYPFWWSKSDQRKEAGAAATVAAKGHPGGYGY